MRRSRHGLLHRQVLAGGEQVPLGGRFDLDIAPGHVAVGGEAQLDGVVSARPGNAATTQRAAASAGSRRVMAVLPFTHVLVAKGCRDSAAQTLIWRNCFIRYDRPKRWPPPGRHPPAPLDLARMALAPRSPASRRGSHSSRRPGGRPRCPCWMPFIVNPTLCIGPVILGILSRRNGPSPPVRIQHTKASSIDMPGASGDGQHLAKPGDVDLQHVRC
jgi:hypothetical protein